MDKSISSNFDDLWSSNRAVAAQLLCNLAKSDPASRILKGLWKT